VESVLIAEMLLLVAVNDKGHVSPWSGGSLLNVGLAGALLAELAMGGQLTIAGDGTVRAGPGRGHQTQ
jgi:Golgi phosphoprotein 3 (GPP34)